MHFYNPNPNYKLKSNTVFKGLVEAIINNLRRDSQINEAIVLELKDEPDNGSLFTLILQKR